MFNHLTLRVRHLRASIAFYRHALKPLGYVIDNSDRTSPGFGPLDAPMFWLVENRTKPTQRMHIAFKARDHAAVDAFYRAALAAGGRDNGPPGPRPDYAPRYYAAFVFDPDGNNIEAVRL
jgi:catechol 2,3-dioxygenase-like lactoylglutathione lyase family enzyme